jgi:hypothetical protein
VGDSWERGMLRLERENLYFDSVLEVRTEVEMMQIACLETFWFTT